MHNLDLEIRSTIEPHVLGVLRAMVTSVSTQAGFDEEAVAQIEMAVDEACANVVRHAYKHLGYSSDFAGEEQCDAALPRLFNPQDESDVHLTLQICVDEEAICFRIIDSGAGLESHTHSRMGVESLEEYIEKGGTGGLGSLIIRNFMDKVEYDTAPNGGTILTMTKYRQRTTASST